MSEQRPSLRDGARAEEIAQALFGLQLFGNRSPQDLAGIDGMLPDGRTVQVKLDRRIAKSRRIWWEWYKRNGLWNGQSMGDWYRPKHSAKCWIFVTHGFAVLVPQDILQFTVHRLDLRMEDLIRTGMLEPTSRGYWIELHEIKSHGSVEFVTHNSDLPRWN